LDCGGKRSAAPLSEQTCQLGKPHESTVAALRLPAQSKMGWPAPPIILKIFSKNPLQKHLTDHILTSNFAHMANAKKFKLKAALLGVGLDSDGKKRITTGPNFALVGGTEETHEQMTEKAVKINEKLKARGKQLEEISREEFDDIAQEVGLKKIEPPQKPSR
jgi:hypothetical protein